MSQNQPKSPEPKKTTPKNQSGTSVQKVTQTLQQSWNKAQPALKAQSIKALRGTIQLLEGVAEKLEAEPTPSAIAPVSTSTEVLSAAQDVEEVVPVPVETPLVEEPLAAPDPELLNPPTTQESAQPEPEVWLKTPTTQDPVQPEPEVLLKTPKTEKPATFVDKFLPSLERVQCWWTALLKQIRALLPASLNQKLSDWGLTSAIATVIVLLLWTTVVLLPDKSSEVAKLPPPPAEIPTPPELTAPRQPETVPIAPAPAPVLTPEQNLIAAIQNQVSEITEKYANGLIQSIQANFPSSLLVVKVSEGWYNLSQSQQDKLADEMLRRSQELDFSKLQITDSEGTALARSPVVGSHMVILKRSTSQQVESHST
jgi:hypothetical protein